MHAVRCMSGLRVARQAPHLLVLRHRLDRVGCRWLAGVMDLCPLVIASEQVVGVATRSLGVSSGRDLHPEKSGGAGSRGVPFRMPGPPLVCHATHPSFINAAHLQPQRATCPEDCPHPCKVRAPTGVLRSRWGTVAHGCWCCCPLLIALDSCSACNGKFHAKPQGAVALRPSPSKERSGRTRISWMDSLAKRFSNVYQTCTHGSAWL